MRRMHRTPTLWKGFVIAGSLALFATANSQTQPIQPKTPDVKVPPQLTLPPPKEVTLGSQPLAADEAVAIALKNQPLTGIAKGSLMSAQGRTQQAGSGLLPDFNANAAYTQTSFIRGTQTGSSQSGSQYTSSASVTQLLFDFGRTRDSLRQEEALERSSGHLVTRTQQTVALDVRLALHTFAQSIEDVGTSDANVTNRQRQLDEAQARLNSGLGAPGDVVSAKTSLASAVIALTSARDTALNSRVALAQLMGIDPRTPITPAASTEPKLENEGDLQRLVETALKDRPDLKSAEDQVAAARYSVSFAEKGNLPKITVGAGVGSRGQTDPLATETGTFSINLTWNFADSGFTAGAVKTAKGSELAAHQTLIQVGQQVVSDVSQAFVDLQSANQRVDLANVEVANALEFLRISEGRYNGGIGVFQDILTAQSALVTAQRDQSQAKADVERARARMRAAIGSL